MTTDEQIAALTAERDRLREGSVMPVKVTAFKCAHGCGGKYRSTRRLTIQHEEICFFNPLRRACQSCRYFDTFMETEYRPYHDGVPGSADVDYKVRFCSYGIDREDEKEGPDISEKLVSNCPLWEPKKEGGDAK